jgi:hypothetical protein
VIHVVIIIIIIIIIIITLKDLGSKYLIEIRSLLLEVFLVTLTHNYNLKTKLPYTRR